MRRIILPLKENHLFSKAYTKGKCEVTKLCAVYVMRNFKRNPDGSPMKTKLGITVNRKLGKACKRNRVKRLIREAYRENYSYIKDGYIMVIAARAAAFAPHIKSADMSKAVRSVVSKEDFFDIKKAPQKKK
jgi:ribonuclease P protein component